VEPRPLARALLHMNAAYLADALARSPTPDRDEALRTLWTIWSRILGVTGDPRRRSAAG
jgi:hypothetical protein